MLQRIILMLALAATVAIATFRGARGEDAPPAGDKPKLKLNRDADEKAAATAAKEKAEEQEAAKKQAEAKKGSTTKEDKEKDDPFAIPEGGVKELLAFVTSVANYRPASQDDLRRLRSDGFAAMKQAAERIKRIATDEDKQLPGFAEADGALLYFRAQEASPESPGKNRQLANDLKKYFAEFSEPSKYAVSAAQQLPMMLDFSGKPQVAQTAIPIYRELGAALASSSDPQVAETGLKMQGAARRLGLVGKPLEISGTEMDGKKFELKSLRGKVVLVDFWATWCGPCLRELPNVKKNYDQYHDKGFEVVGISLDDDRPALETFLADNQKPWITLYDGGWNQNPLTTYYGIMGIPTVILVDQEGNVVDTQASGPKLGKLLAKLLGPAEVEEKASDDASDGEKSD